MDRNGQTRLRLVVLLVALLVVGVLGDWAMRNREMDTLLDQVERSERAMVTGSDALLAITELYDGRLKAGVISGMKDEWTRDMERQASQTAAEVITAGTYVADVSVLPWHKDIRRARDRYVLHSREWEARLTAVSNNAAAWFERQPRITATFRVAEKAFKDASPRRSLYGIDERIERIFQD